MKLKFSKKFLTVLFCLISVMAVLCFVGCGEKAGGPTNNDDPSSTDDFTSSEENFVMPEELILDDGKSVVKSTTPNTVASQILTQEDLSTLYTEKYSEELNPKYTSRTESLDNIFNPDALGQIVLVFDRSEWDKHLYYCDKSGNKHEDSVVAKGFYFTKDNKEWFFNDIGFRIRGNTSRRRPQEGNGAGNNDYIQAHFALDFEEWTEDDKKLANCMKGLILKRFKDDPTYSREVYSYNLFRQNGIWIAPRAAYTRLIIQIDEGDGTFETVDYGIYSMIEEIKKQFLKERTEETGGYLSSNKGNLWKCLGANFKDTGSIGEEKVYFERDGEGNILKFVRNTVAYDYKSDDFAKAEKELTDFIAELNNLPNCTDGVNDENDKLAIKNFYTEKMAGDLFLRTYAINVILGMWDDYWINNNNFYFYFDEDEKAYFIPYDYDNSLGVCHMGVDAGKANPYTWGNLTDGKHPLIQKILQVPEYMKLYRQYLLEYSNEDSFFDDDKSIARIKKWQSMIEPYIYSDKLIYSDTFPSLEDKSATEGWANTYKPYTLYTPGEWNYFTVRQNTIKNAKLSGSNSNPSSELVLTLDAGDGYFWTGSGDGTDKLYCNFKSGDAFSKIKSSCGFQGWTVWLNGDGLKFGYEKDGHFYWPDGFCDSEGNSVSNGTKFYESATVYTKWIDFTGSVVPYYFNDWSTITFVFNPADFDCDCPENATVYLMSVNSNWQENEAYILEKQGDGTYSKSFNFDQYIRPGLNSFNGYKFKIKETGAWIGYKEYNHELPEIFAEYSDAYNLRIAY